MATDNTHHIKLIGAQAKIWDLMYNGKKNVIAVVPVGSGKSFLASLLLPIAATTPSMHKGRDLLCVAPTYGELERAIWSPLKKTCLEVFKLEDESQINNSKKTITFSNGVKIYCVSAESGLKGINASLIVADEAAEYSEEALQELTNRIRPAVGDPNSGGRFILISTPEGKNAFHKLYEEAVAHPEDWDVIHLDYKSMRSQSKAWIEKQKYLLSPLKFKKDMECDWGSVEDQFFYTWNKHYLTDSYNKIVDRKSTLYSFHDFNKKCMTAIVAQVIGEPRTESGRIEVLKSYAIESCSTEQLAIKIKADFPNRPIQCIMDMSGAQTNRDTTSPFGVTDRTLLEKHGFRIVNTRAGNPLISDTDNSANAFINQGRLLVPHTETKLIESLETYHFEDASRKTLVKYKEPNLMHIDGLGDCLRYGIHHLFPLRPEFIKNPNPVRFGHGIS